MPDRSYRSFGPGKTKSSPKLRIIRFARHSWCNREMVGEIRPDVPFDDVVLTPELCVKCSNAMTFAYARVIRQPL